MIKISNIKLPIDYTVETLHKEIARKLKITVKDILECNVLKKSLDARRADNLHFVLSVAANIKNFDCKTFDKDIEKYNKTEYKFLKAKHVDRPVIIGFGPSGIFAAYILAKAGLKPIVHEKGSDIDARRQAVNDFVSSGILNADTNIQFGEGGAGAFSDGKLYSGISDLRRNFVLETLHRFGAPEEILYSAKPHIGTDKLRDVVKNMRNEIISLGGEINFCSALTGIKTNGERLQELTVNGKIESCNNIILCIGHSSRETFDMLNKNGVSIEQKDFSIGVRIEHLQKNIDKAQYKDVKLRKYLGASEYKLFSHLKNGRTVYTFCMCPGGEVVGASSHSGRIVTNGMSEFKRDKTNANSALLVNVTKKDFQSEHPLAGMFFQEKYEKMCYDISGSYKAPCVRVEDFLKGRVSKNFGEVLPTYPLGTVMADLNLCLPRFAIDGLKEGIIGLDNKLKGFANGDAVLTGVETRSSSPVRILRGESMESNYKGIYPCGEGAGYAGGIMSSAVDGIKCAEALIEKLNNK